MPDRTGAFPEADRGRGGVRAHHGAAAEAHRASPGVAGGHRRGGGEGHGQGAGDRSAPRPGSCSAEVDAPSATPCRPPVPRPARCPAPKETGVRGDGSPDPACARPSFPPRDAGGRGHGDLTGPGSAAPTAPAAGPPHRWRSRRSGPAWVAPPATPAEGRTRRPCPFLALAGLALVGAIAGFLTSGAPADREQAAKLGSSRSAGTLGLSFPDGWKRVAQAPDIPGLASRSRSCSRRTPRAPARGGPGRRRWTDAPAADLPRPASRRPRETMPSSWARYRPTATRSSQPRHCRSRDRVRRAHLGERRDRRLRCAHSHRRRLRAGLRARGGEPPGHGRQGAELGPSEAYAKSVGATFERLNTAVSAGAKRLSRARTPAAQAGRGAHHGGRLPRRREARLGGACWPMGTRRRSGRQRFASGGGRGVLQGGRRGQWRRPRRLRGRTTIDSLRGKRPGGSAAPSRGAGLPGRIAAEAPAWPHRRG